MTNANDAQDRTPSGTYNRGAQNAQAYLRTKVMSASPEELRLMLLEGAARFARQGRDGLMAQDYEQSFEGFSQSRNIIVELISTMNEEVAPELCQRVRSLYTFIYAELVKASFEKDAARATSAIDLIDYEVETWKLLMSKLEEERAAGQTRMEGSSSITPGPTSPRVSDAGAPPIPRLSVSG